MHVVSFQLCWELAAGRCRMIADCFNPGPGGELSSLSLSCLRSAECVCPFLTYQRFPGATIYPWCVRCLSTYQSLAGMDSLQRRTILSLRIAHLGHFLLSTPPYIGSLSFYFLRHSNKRELTSWPSTTWNAWFLHFIILETKVWISEELRQ